MSGAPRRARARTHADRGAPPPAAGPRCAASFFIGPVAEARASTTKLPDDGDPSSSLSFGTFYGRVERSGATAGMLNDGLPPARRPPPAPPAPAAAIGR
ncbi:hypothetical protein EVAR_27808_1 [Eumeta japonica]|uniref:Uncharacterized protein n=1 Tax=Eumeta variegata TaxID=151549 RepID=A0A4C1VJQ5_EUMVA|nr:hypothetical protein EVAR_27808_1 [Eumeta japonica]